MALVNGTPTSPDANGLITGTGQSDTIIADAADSGAEIRGLSGDDVIGTTGDNMTLDGGPGMDSLSSDGANNTLLGGDDGDFLLSQGNATNTTMEGGPGMDQLIGGGQNDTASYANAAAGVTVDLSAMTASNDGDGGSDFLALIENVTGSAYADSLTGDVGPNVLEGDGGDDTLNGGGGSDVFKYSFELSDVPGEPTTFKFTDWLSEKYGKDFGDELPDFERGHHDHHHSHGKHHHHHGKHHHDNGKHHNHHAKHEHDHHHGHHHKHGGCDDHQSHEWGLSQSFFAKNYGEWIREVVVADLLAQGFDLDVNGDGEIGIRLNARDPDGNPRIEGLSDEQLSAIFDDRDEVTLRHHHHGHDKWYSNSYTSSSGEAETIVTSDDGFDTIVGFNFGEDHLEFSGFGSALTLEEFTSLFEKTESDVNSDGVMDTVLASADHAWGVNLLNVSGHTEQDFLDQAILFS